MIAGNLSIGDIVEANFYVLMLIWPLRMVGMLLGQLSRAAASAGRIDTVLATEPAIEDDPGAAALAPGPGAVRFERGHLRVRAGPARSSTASTWRFAGARPSPWSARRRPGRAPSPA